MKRSEVNFLLAPRGLFVLLPTEQEKKNKSKMIVNADALSLSLFLSCCCCHCHHYHLQKLQHRMTFDLNEAIKTSFSVCSSSSCDHREWPIEWYDRCLLFVFITRCTHTPAHFTMKLMMTSLTVFFCCQCLC